MSSESRRAGQEGLTLVGVLVMVAISSLFLAYAAQTWEAELWRDREKELIFRGEQYKLALEKFYAIHKRLPNDVKELVELEPRAIRRLYKDPMTGEDFQIIPGLGPQGPCNVPTTPQGQPGEAPEGESGPPKSNVTWSRPSSSQGTYVCGVQTTAKRERWFHPELNTGGGLTGAEEPGGMPGVPGMGAGLATGGTTPGGFVFNPPRPQRRPKPRAQPGGRRPGTRRPPTRPGTSRPGARRTPPNRPPRR